MIAPPFVVEIRRLFFVERWPVRTIARRLELPARVVRHALRVESSELRGTR